MEDRSYPVAFYRSAARQAARLHPADSPYSRALDAFNDRLQAGTDWPMPVGPQKAYPISEFINEADRAGAILLFAACSAAAARRDAEVAQKLRAFVAHVASEYAATYEDMWED